MRATNAVLLDTDYASRDGTVPTGRFGARRNLGDKYLRVAGYEGFRVPSLNELYRPFRVGNNNTVANAGLKPEKLYGAEIGWGGVFHDVSWNLTGFWNKMHDAITNVTIASSPAGVTFQRENAGDIKALGLEGDASWHATDDLSLRAAFSLTDARVTENSSAIPAGMPSLTGNRPAQAPPVTITAGATWTPLTKLKLDANLHWESARFEDDQNTMRLGSAFVLDLRASYLLTETLSAFVGVDNATNADIATAQAADGTISYGEPKMWEVGLTYQP